MASTPKTGTGVLDLSAFLANRTFNRFHATLAFLSCLITFFDGVDFGIIAYAAPYIRDELHLAGDQIGLVFSSSVFGQILGALICTYIADRAGRRPVIIVCALLAALLTIAMGFTASFEQLLIVRFLGGVTIGGLLPVAWALNIEAMPDRRRATAVALIMFGFTLGGSFAAPLTNLIAPDYGWQAAFFLAGAVTLVMAFILLPTLPESARFLASRGAPFARIAPILKRIDPGFDPSRYERCVLTDEKPVERNFNPADLFRGRLLFITPLIWASYFFSSIAAYLGAMWGPIFFEQLGMARTHAALLGSASGLTGAVLSVVLLRFTEARGPRWVALFPLLATPFYFVVALGVLSPALLAPAIFMGMILKFGGHGGVVSIIGLYYPSAIRSNAGGWANAAGKAGGVLGPMIGAMFATGARDVLGVYFVLAACTFLVALCVTGLSAIVRKAPKMTASEPEAQPGDE
ncbi:MAG: MFS transporter [Parvularculaceae bacterium]